MSKGKKKTKAIVRDEVINVVANVEIDYDRLAEALVKAQEIAEEKKYEVKKKKQKSGKLSKKERLLFIMFLIRPEKVASKLNDITYTLIELLMTMMLTYLGKFIRFLGACLLFGGIYYLIKMQSLNYIIYVAYSLVFFIIGSYFIVAGKQIDENEYDKEYILGVFSTILGFLGFVVALLALLVAI